MVLASDNFNDNSMGAQWNEFENTSGTVAEANQRVECTSVGFDSDSHSGYVTVASHDLTAADFQVEVTVNSTCEEISMWIALTKITTGDVWNEANWYRITKVSDGNYYVQDRVAGGGVNTLASGARAAATGVLRITISGGTITFYENGNNRYSGAYALANYTCYVYFYRRQGIGDPGTDCFDNFLNNLSTGATAARRKLRALLGVGL